MVRAKSVEMEQEELPNMPPASPIGKAARALLGVRDEIEETVERLDKKEDDAREKLLGLMEQEGKDAIVVDGITFRKIHKDASDEIRVIQKRGRKKKEEEEE